MNTRLFTKTALAAALLLCAAFISEAKVRLPQIIDHCMVLQRDREATIWGWADPGEKVTVRFDGSHWFAQADAEGNWSVTLPAQSAGGPYVLEVNEIVLRDILVGDVWLLSGQSNQETPIERLLEKYPEINFSNNHMIRMYKVPTQDSPSELKEDIPEGERWHSAVASDVLAWKALAYWYATLAYEQTGIPQGMIVSSLGGSAIESWICHDSIDKFPQLVGAREEWIKANPEANDPEARSWKSVDFDDSAWQSLVNPVYFADAGIPTGTVVWYRKTIDVPESMDGRHARIYLGRLVDADEVYVNGVYVGGIGYFGPPRKYDVPAGVLRTGKNVVAVRLTGNSSDSGFVPDKPYRLVGDEAVIDLTGEWKYKIASPSPDKPFGRRPAFTASGLHNGMIYPLRHYTIGGAIWYQGETNAGDAANYPAYLSELIRGWREEFGRPDLPVVICQLPNYMEVKAVPVDEPWARMREAQLKVYQSTDNCYLATSYNTGEWNDIHPLNKKDMAATVLLGTRKIYGGEDIVAMGPVFREMKVEKGRAVLYFDEVGKGLATIDGKPLKHFAIAGADGKFVWAEAVIKGKTVVVSSPEVPEPVAVRYAWANNPEGANLCGKNGVLASPFRTDSW